MTDRRSLPVPDGLEGERVDAALARLLGFSRTQAAELVAAGGVTPRRGGRRQVRPGAAGVVARGRAARARHGAAVVAEQVPGLRSSTTTTTSWSSTSRSAWPRTPARAGPGPTVLGGLAAAGYRISTSGAAERQGIVHRLDVGTCGLMVVAKTERPTPRSSAPSRTARSTRSTTRSCRVSPTRSRAPSTRRSAGTPGTTRSSPCVAGGKPSVTHYEVLEAFRSASLLEVHLETGRTHQIRVHFAALRHPCVGDLTYGADPTLAARLGPTRQWLHAMRLGLQPPRHRRDWCGSSPYPDDLQHALDGQRLTRAGCAARRPAALRPAGGRPGAATSGTAEAADRR